MNILFLSDYDRLAVEIAKGLNESGYQTTLITTLDTDVAFSKNISTLSKKLQWYKNAVRSLLYRKILLKAKARYSFFQDIDENKHYYKTEEIIKKNDITPDVIIILFDYRLLTTKTIQQLYQWSKARIFWMIPDMKPMTGGCSYAEKCINYEKECNNCPAVDTSYGKNFAVSTLQKKIANLSQIPIEIISGSSYQYDQAKKSTVFKDKKIHKIYFPSNEKIFFHGDKTLAKKALGINLDKRLILFGASSLSEERKGMKYIITALQNLEKEIAEKCVLLIVGNGESEEIAALNYEKIKLGYVSYDKLATAYQAADFFISSTIDDSGPVMVSQSVMCGTPVVAFEMGIALDIVLNNYSGIICDLENQKELENAILKMLEMPKSELNKMNENCRAISSELGFKNFLNNLETLING